MSAVTAEAAASETAPASKRRPNTEWGGLLEGDGKCVALLDTGMYCSLIFKHSTGCRLTFKHSIGCN